MQEAMEINHIFIFDHTNGKSMDHLLDFGFVEGSNRVHSGQGTSNRKIYFENFFLEILWVHDREEILSELVRPTGLSKRAGFHESGYSPFGLCIENRNGVSELFNQAIHYQPKYFPVGMPIMILDNEASPDLPWTFLLPFLGNTRKNNEPLNHKNGVRKLTRASFFYEKISDNKFIEAFTGEDQIKFIKSDKPWLNLTFDSGKQRISKVLESLKLKIDF